MTEYLHTTFGSQKVLRAIQQAHPKRHMFLTSDDCDHTNFQLLEQTDLADSVFTNPISYFVSAKAGATDEIRGWIHFTFLTLPGDEQNAFFKQWDAYQADTLKNMPGLIGSELLQRVDDRNQIAIMTTWRVREYYTMWTEKNDRPLQKYTDLASRYNVRHSSYSLAAFTK